MRVLFYANVQYLRVIIKVNHSKKFRTGKTMEIPKYKLHFFKRSLFFSEFPKQNRTFYKVKNETQAQKVTDQS